MLELTFQGLTHAGLVTQNDLYRTDSHTESFEQRRQPVRLLSLTGPLQLLGAGRESGVVERCPRLDGDGAGVLGLELEPEAVRRRAAVPRGGSTRFDGVRAKALHEVASTRRLAEADVALSLAGRIGDHGVDEVVDEGGLLGDARFERGLGHRASPSDPKHPADSRGRGRGCLLAHAK
ncbi:hypothetical protein [Streptomyces sp. IMTB 2501]|uniref:hypothetical protein n=1 Tax=Streptomyces sp. IMTB 2501 TaxID=1776340 RepID=UPI0015BEA71E|nr:hypothetical protein [Streptomyces sp. IMTB 2501]